MKTTKEVKPRHDIWLNPTCFDYIDMLANEDDDEVGGLMFALNLFCRPTCNYFTYTDYITSNLSVGTRIVLKLILEQNGYEYHEHEEEYDDEYDEPRIIGGDSDTRLIDELLKGTNTEAADETV